MLNQELKSFVAATIVVFCYSSDAKANSEEISDICENAAHQAAAESNVPLSVLRAISLTETGRNIGGEFEPWPWTVNMEGAGKWFDNYAEAKNYVDTHFNRGARSFDVGCFQVNYKWHHQEFSSIEQMFDPLENARYAAKFLTQLFDEFGSWPKAAGAYHSRTPKYAKKYTARFNRIRGNLDTPPPVELTVVEAVSPESVPMRVNRFPLLQRGGQGQMASLVPLGQVGNRFIDVTNSSIRPVK